MVMLNIQAISALQDNYIWLFQLAGDYIVVDPGAAKPVLQALPKQANLSHILLTHHHFDHTGGVSQLKAEYPNVIVYGPKGCHPELDIVIAENDEVLGFKVLATPGHTIDHHIYVGPVIFCGDHLFRFGCGRVFETDMSTMYDSLCKLKSLDANLMCYPAHEYTLANLRFAAKHKPFPGIDQLYNALITETITVPMSLSEQLQLNPFLNCIDLAEFSMLRQLKDNFK